MLPNVDIFRNAGLQMNSYGYITTNESMETNIPGVYAAGDVRDKKYRQIATAVGDGTVASLEVIRKL
jgi:thioredoxin reductase (NADPH)